MGPYDVGRPHDAQGKGLARDGFDLAGRLSYDAQLPRRDLAGRFEREGESAMNPDVSCREALPVLADQPLERDGDSGCGGGDRTGDDRDAVDSDRL